MTARAYCICFALFALALGCGQPPAHDGQMAGQEGGPAEPQIPPPSGISAPQRSEVYLTARDVFGELVVREGDFEMEAGRKPWSSWWYPASDTAFFDKRGEGLSPLEKYDLYVARAHGRQTRSAEYERKNLYFPDQGSGWEGHCDAWSIAALLEDEPVVRRPIEIDGVSFSTGDLKALTIKNYEVVENLTTFGQRNDGLRDDLYEDIYPDQLHLVIQKVMGERRQSLILDTDPGIQVWNRPIWRALGKVEADSTDPHVLHVTLWLKGADFHVPVDFIGTVAVTQEYHYDLFGDRDGRGDFHVLYGVWTGRSVDDHPDFATVLGEGSPHRSRNSELDPEILKEIVLRATRKL